MRIFGNPEVGLCWPTPSCGDGVIDPLNEVCDDGNTASGDGCSSDCDTAEFDQLCGDAEPLVLDTDITGTTVGGPSGYGGSCELYIVVPTKTYSFEVPGPGRTILARSEVTRCAWRRSLAAAPDDRARRTARARRRDLPRRIPRNG